MNGWIGVDLDGTLAEYHGWKGADHIGEPIPAMVERVKAWLAEGKDVRIFTARVWPLGTFENHISINNTEQDLLRVACALEARKAVQAWCMAHFGRELPITCVKDYGMVELWDDRAVQVVKNTGARADGGK